MANLKLKTTNVPRETSNPIEYLLERGWSEPALAVEWNLKTEQSVRRLRNFAYVPRLRTATLMAQTFGWGSAGEVIDFWADKVKR